MRCKITEKSVNEKKVRKEEECEVRWEKVTWGKLALVGGWRLKRSMILSNSTGAITQAFILLLDFPNNTVKSTEPRIKAHFLFFSEK